MRNPPKRYIPPFRANGSSIIDANGNYVAELSAIWGPIQRDQMTAWLADAANAYAAQPQADVPQTAKESDNLLAEFFSHSAIDEAMQDSWNDICSDTGCHPLDIEHGRGKHLTFKPSHWANQIAKRLFLRAVKVLLKADASSPQMPQTLKEPADWSGLPRDLYVTSVKTDGIVYDVQCCSVPMAIGPEVRYSVTRPDGESGK